MKKLFILSFFIGAAIHAHSRMMLAEGTYQGENLYLLNPYDSVSGTFRVKYILVNSVQYFNHKSTAVEIDLSNYKLGDYILVQIFVDEAEKIVDLNMALNPTRILNPEALRSKSTFEIVYFNAAPGTIKWTTNNETTQEPYIIERFQNNMWVPVGKVIANGSDGYNNYYYKVKHAENNTYRLKQRDLSSFTYSEPYVYIPQ